MNDSLGLSIGMTNLVAARIGRPPVMRRSVLTLFNDRAAADAAAIKVTSRRHDVRVVAVELAPKTGEGQ